MFEQATELPDDRTTKIALDALEAGITAAQPNTVLSESLSLDGSMLQVNGENYDLSMYDEVIVLGGGTAQGESLAISTTFSMNTSQGASSSLTIQLPQQESR